MDPLYVFLKALELLDIAPLGGDPRLKVIYRTERINEPIEIQRQANGLYLIQEEDDNRHKHEQTMDRPSLVAFITRLRLSIRTVTMGRSGNNEVDDVILFLRNYSANAIKLNLHDNVRRFDSASLRHVGRQNVNTPARTLNRWGRVMSNMRITPPGGSLPSSFPGGDEYKAAEADYYKRASSLGQGASKRQRLS
jgi:hypothetical protein